MEQNKDIYKIGILPEYNFRFLITDATSSIEQIIHLQDLNDSSAQLVAKTVLGAFFISGMVKEDNLVGLQIEGEGPVHRVIAFCDRYGAMRGTATNKDVLTDTRDMSLGIGSGIMRATIWGGQKILHQSITKLEKHYLEYNLIKYIEESDQITSFLTMNIEPIQKKSNYSGMIFQALPNTDEYWIGELKHRIENYFIEPELLFADGIDSAIQKLSLELDTEFKVLESGKPHFHCGCSSEKIQRLIISMGKSESESILLEYGKIEITCDFCSKKYILDPEEVHLLFFS